MSNCLNCGEEITGNFCSNCGQKKFKRIDRKYIIDELQYSFIHTNKGFFYSVKNIIRNPGKTAKDFINGNRVNHYKPILLAFLLSTFSAFISYKVIGLNEIMDNYYAGKVQGSTFMKEYQTFTSSYNAIIMLLMVPIYSFFTKLAFRKWGNNYYEHIVMNAYILSFYTIFLIIIVYPLMYIFRDNSSFIMALLGIVFFSIPVIMVLFFKDFYKDKPIRNIMLKVAAVCALTIVFMFIVMIIAMFGYIFYAAKFHPELLKEFTNKK